MGATILLPEYLTCREIMNRHPELYANFNWGTHELNTLYKCSILQGKVSRKNHCTMITESSLIRLIRYANQLLDSQKVELGTSDYNRRIGYQSPTEILSRHPQLQDRFGWGVKELAVFVRCKILIGYLGRDGRTLIDVTSLQNLITFVNQSFELLKVPEY